MRDLVTRWTQNRPLLIFTLMTTYSAQSLLITASKDRGSFTYDASAAVLLAEVFKLLFAFTMLTPEARVALRPSFTCLVFAVPAALYMIQNRLVFEALRFLTPPEYQLLNNSKLFTTSVVFRLAMQRRLKMMQWLALLLLGIGMAVATHQFDATDSADKGANVSARRGGVVRGVGVMLIASWCSACAGVANEWLIKRSPNPMEANLWLYVFGSLVVCCQLSLTPGAWPRFWRFEGFSLLTWLVVVCNAVLGQSIAFLFRYADSIVKLYAVCAAMAFTTAVSVLLFGYEIRFHMVAGYATCAVSMCLYYLPSEILLADDWDVFTGNVCRRDNIAGKRL